MDRLSSLDFDADFGYDESAAGILVPIRLIHGDSQRGVDRFYADILGLPDAGLERRYRTVTGSFQAFGHQVTVETLGLQWSALVFFHALGNPAHSFIGRRGWLDRVRLGIVHRERRLFLGHQGR